MWLLASICHPTHEFWVGACACILQFSWHLFLLVALYSGLSCEDHIIKGILFIYSLLAPIHSLQLLCHSNHMAMPAAVFVGPTKFISKSCNSLAMVLQWSCNCLAMLLTLYCTFSAPKHLLRMSFRSFAVNSSFHCMQCKHFESVLRTYIHNSILVTLE